MAMDLLSSFFYSMLLWWMECRDYYP